MGTGLEVAVIGMALAGAATSAAQARAQNQAAKKSARLANENAVLRQKQLDEAADMERKKRQNEAAQIRGRLAVAGAAADVGLGGSFDTLSQQATYDEGLNLQIIEKNRDNQKANVRSGLEADLVSISSRLSNPILAGFTGGLGGAQAGLSLGDGINKINESAAQRAAARKAAGS